MTKKEAVERARRVAHQTGRDIYVIAEPDDGEQGFALATRQDAMTHYAGCRVEYVAEGGR